MSDIELSEEAKPHLLKIYDYEDENGYCHLLLEGAKVPENWKKVNF